MAASIASSVRAVRATPRWRVQCSTCSEVFPGGTLVNGPSVSSSKNSLLVKVSNEQPKSGYVSAELACAHLMNASPFKMYAPQVFALNIPSFCASELAESCRNVRYFFVKAQRLSDRFVYAHITRGLVASRFAGCRPRGGKPEIAMPPGAIMVSAHTEYSSEKSERLVMRCTTVTSVPVADIRTSISFCRLVSGSTGALAISPFAVMVISTGTLSGAQVATGSSGAFQTRSPPRSWCFSYL